MQMTAISIECEPSRFCKEKIDYVENAVIKVTQKSLDIRTARNIVGAGNHYCRRQRCDHVAAFGLLPCAKDFRVARLSHAAYVCKRLLWLPCVARAPIGSLERLNARVGERQPFATNASTTSVIFAITAAFSSADGKPLRAQACRPRNHGSVWSSEPSG